jgi:hypothetical protein
MFAVRKCKTFEFRTPDYSAWWWDLDVGVLGLQEFPPSRCVLRVRLCDNPAYDSCEEVVRDFAAVREVDFFEILGIIGHF